MSVYRLCKPKQSFSEFIRTGNKRSYLEDMHRMSALLHYASHEKSKLDLDVRVEITTKIAEKISQRQARWKEKQFFGRWDGRHWRGLEKLRVRLAQSYGAKS